MKQEQLYEEDYEDESLRNYAVTFANSFLEMAGINNHELVADVDSGSQDNFHVLTYSLKPSGDEKRAIEFTYVGWPTSNPLLKDRQYVIGLYLQTWNSKEDSLENFVKGNDLLQLHGNQIKQLVEDLQDNTPEGVKRNASPYKDRDYRVIQRSKVRGGLEYNYAMIVDFLCHGENWKERARVIGNIEKIVVSYYEC